MFTAVVGFALKCHPVQGAGYPTGEMIVLALLRTSRCEKSIQASASGHRWDEKRLNHASGLGTGGRRQRDGLKAVPKMRPNARDESSSPRADAQTR